MGSIFGKCNGAGALIAIFVGMDAVDVADGQSVVGEDDVIKLLGMVGTDSFGKNLQKTGVIVKLTDGIDFRNDGPLFNLVKDGLDGCSCAGRGIVREHGKQNNARKTTLSDLLHHVTNVGIGIAHRHKNGVSVAQFGLQLLADTLAVVGEG